MPRGKRSKSKETSIDIQVIIVTVVSIILGILIYSRSGYIGENLSPVLRRTNPVGQNT